MLTIKKLINLYNGTEIETIQLCGISSNGHAMDTHEDDTVITRLTLLSAFLINICGNSIIDPRNNEYINDDIQSYINSISALHKEQHKVNVVHVVHIQYIAGVINCRRDI